MKKITAILLLLVITQLSYAQQKGRFRFSTDIGVAMPKDGGIGALVNLEPQFLLRDNLTFGMRFGVAGLAKDVMYFNMQKKYQGEVAANVSVAGTITHFFNKGKSNIAPYLGAGFGYFALSAVEIDQSFTAPTEVGNLEADFAWAPIVRAGVELRKFRMGVEYNFVPNRNLQNLSGAFIGEAINHYAGFTLGYTIGGGKWQHPQF
jgi:outer membrane protein W